MSTLYGVLKSLHIVSIVAWMAGLLYLFRLFVYHQEEKIEVVKERFQMMEGRLYRLITVPAMVASVVFGLSLIAVTPELLKQPWLHTKLLFVVGMIAVTLWADKLRDDLALNRCTLSSKRLRFLNELPTLLLIAIVFLVVMKPFT